MARGGKREGAGRPKGSRSAANKDQIATLSEMAREHTHTALNVLVQIATSGESEAARVSACNAILDRAYGKPQQAVELSGPDGGPIQTQEVPARDRIASRLARLSTGGGSGKDTGGTE